MRFSVGIFLLSTHRLLIFSINRYFYNIEIGGILEFMKIAINCIFFKPKAGGIKEYIQNLVKNLEILDFENEYVVYILENCLEYAEKNNLTSRFRIKAIPFKGDSLTDNIKRSLFESFFWRNEEKKEKWDIFHSPFFHSPSLNNTKIILTVHDLRFKRFPETYAFLRYQFLKFAVKKSISRACHLISISDFTKSEIMDAYGVPEDKITVIHEAVNSSNFVGGTLSESDRKKIGQIQDAKFILSVGHLEPRKNYDRLIESFKILRERMPQEDMRLVIVGKKGNNYKDTINKINKTDGVLYLDFVSDGLLSWLYANASLFVFPSIYEGFGFPPLESAVNGLISSVSNASCIPEICRNYVDYFNPYDINDMAASMQRCLTDESLKNRLKERLNEWVNSYSWKRNAEETLNVYRNVVYDVVM